MVAVGVFFVVVQNAAHFTRQSKVTSDLLLLLPRRFLEEASRPRVKLL